MSERLFQLRRRMAYLCLKCDVPVELLLDEPRTETGIPHKCPRCGRMYELQRAYPYIEVVWDRFQPRKRGW